jgi:hypothetical protein
VAKVKTGLAFSLICDLGFAVGIATHSIERIGQLVWIAEPTFDEEPTLDQVREIKDWRWPVFFPLDAAIRRRIVNSLGVVPVPAKLQKFPLLRSSTGRGWKRVKFVDGSSRSAGPTKDASIPIYRIVNDTALKERIVSGWKPEEEW